MTSSLPSPFTIFPLQLLQQTEKSFWHYEGTPFCYPEVNHRSKAYTDLNQKSMEILAKYYNVPSNYHVFYLPIDCGHPSIPFNLNKLTNNRAIYVVNDKQSEHAYDQALKINPSTIKVGKLEDRKSCLQRLGQPFYFYTFYSKLSLETGEYSQQPEPLQGEILICSINNCSHYQSVEIKKHGIVLFETGRGVSLTGMSVLIVRNDLLGLQWPSCPDMLCYQKTRQMNSVIYTPNMFVPFFMLKHLEFNIANKQTLEKTKEQLKKIKVEYEEELSSYTQVAKMQAQGLVKFKYPQVLTHLEALQFGELDGQWLIISLQLANKGNAEEFVAKLFK